jgi:hypothetical protein
VVVAAGDQVVLAVDVDRLHFFDAETGEAIGATGRSGVAQLVHTQEEGIGNLRR